MSAKYSVGKGIDTWKDGGAQTITFIVTEDCNLRCKYCYITGKKDNKIMDLKTAKDAVDYFLSAHIERSEAVIIEFIGGEPLIEVGLIDEITDYFKMKSYELRNDWYWNYRISICTNGVNYLSDEVQDYLNKNKGKISLTITLDGTKEKHDMNRVFPNNKGSYDQIIKGIPHWIENHMASTKVTFASKDLSLLKESIIHLYDLGITKIAANVVFEDMWEENDDIVFENQLIELADYILDNRLYNELILSLFDDTIGNFSSEDSKNTTYCGAGKMIAVGPDGDFFPCIRYKDFSLDKQEQWTVGNIRDGIDMEKVRPFVISTNIYQSDEECLNCSVATGCGFCQGFNYDESSSGTNFSRAKYICKMHKARVRANNYFFGRLFNDFGIMKDSIGDENKKLNILLSNNTVNYCYYEPESLEGEKVFLSFNNLNEIFDYCHKENFSPVLVYDSEKFKEVPKEIYRNLITQHILPIKHYQKSKHLKNSLYVIHDYEVPINSNDKFDNVILNISEENVCNLFYLVQELSKNIKRINIVFPNITKEFDFKEYEIQLKKIACLINEKILNNEKDILDINVLTDVLRNKGKRNCGAGFKSFTVAPDMQIYKCPTEYHENMEAIGNISEGILNLKDEHLLKPEYQPICSECDALQCPNCVTLNKKSTNEVNVSPSFQCRKAIIENNISAELEEYQFMNDCKLKLENNKDPIDNVIEKLTHDIGYYIS